MRRPIHPTAAPPTTTATHQGGEPKLLYLPPHLPYLARGPAIFLSDGGTTRRRRRPPASPTSLSPSAAVAAINLCQGVELQPVCLLQTASATPSSTPHPPRRAPPPHVSMRWDTRERRDYYTGEVGVRDGRSSAPCTFFLPASSVRWSPQCFAHCCSSLPSCRVSFRLLHKALDIQRSRHATT